MTTVSQIISDAFRQSNLIAVGASPTAAEQEEALRYLNRIVKSVFGFEAGAELTSFPLGSEGISKPEGFPGWEDTPYGGWFVPENVRLVCNLSGPAAVYLHPDPSNGSRFAVSDVAGSFGTSPVVVYGNGRLVEGASSVTLSTASLNAEWFFREDLSNWVRYTPLLLTDAFPFPEEFDDYFVTTLSVRINPSYGVSLDAQGQSVMLRGKTQLRARYRQKGRARIDLALTRPSRMTADRASSQDYPGSDSAFERGWGY